MTPRQGAIRWAARLSRWRPALIVVLAGCVALGLAWSVVSLWRQSDAHWQNVAQSVGAHTRLEEEVATGWRCAAVATPTCTRDFDSQAHSVHVRVGALGRAGVPLGVQLRGFEREVSAARAGLDSPRAATRTDAAARIADAQPRLADGLSAAAADQRHLARRDAWVADLEAVLLLIFAGVVAALLLRRFTLVRAAASVSAARERSRNEGRFQSLVTNASDVVTLTDLGGVITFQTPSVTRVLGYPAEEGFGHKSLEWCHPEDQDLVRAAFLRTLSGEELVTTVARWRHADGSWRWLESVRTNLLDDPDVGAVVINSRDVTEQRELADLLAHNVLHDVLTGLPSRALFVDRVDQALRKGQEPAVLIVDLDDFKAINDRLGHAAGDAVLREVADRLLAGATTDNTVARLGADDFGILLERAADGAAAHLVAEQVLAALRDPMVVAGESVVPQASVGVAAASGSGDSLTADELLSRADLAVSAAKGAGKARVVLYETAMRVALTGALDLKARLARALRRGELEVHYQPVVDLASGSVTAVEALVRWRDPNRGLVSPEDFIPAVENSPLIEEIGGYVLRTACQQLARWRRGGASTQLTVSVNVAARQLEGARFVDDVARCLRDSGLAADSLTLEITEGQLVRDIDSAASTMLQLRSLGVRMAIDDFGTGYSSLSYLERLPVNMLKIDRSFVVGIPSDDGSVLLRSIVDLGRALGLQVVAEGVDTEERRQSLREMGCPLGQGFLFAEPLPAEDVLPMLTRRLASEPA